MGLNTLSKLVASIVKRAKIQLVGRHTFGVTVKKKKKKKKKKKVVTSTWYRTREILVC
jgi:DNA-directed RNA polymerase beta' subunit